MAGFHFLRRPIMPKGADEKAAKRKAARKKKENKLVQEMIAKHGRSCIYVTTNIHVTSIELEKIFGKPCRDTDMGCPVCAAYAQWKSNGTIPVVFDRDELVRLAI